MSKVDELKEKLQGIVEGFKEKIPALNKKKGDDEEDFEDEEFDEEFMNRYMDMQKELLLSPLENLRNLRLNDDEDPDSEESA